MCVCGYGCVYGLEVPHLLEQVNGMWSSNIDTRTLGGPKGDVARPFSAHLAPRAFHTLWSVSHSLVCACASVNASIPALAKHCYKLQRWRAYVCMCEFVLAASKYCTGRLSKFVCIHGIIICDQQTHKTRSQPSFLGTMIVQTRTQSVTMVVVALMVVMVVSSKNHTFPVGVASECEVAHAQVTNGQTNNSNTHLCSAVLRCVFAPLVCCCCWTWKTGVPPNKQGVTLQELVQHNLCSCPSSAMY